MSVELDMRILEEAKLPGKNCRLKAGATPINPSPRSHVSSRLAGYGHRAHRFVAVKICPVGMAKALSPAPYRQDSFLPNFDGDMGQFMNGSQSQTNVGTINRRRTSDANNGGMGFRPYSPHMQIGDVHV